MADNAPPKKPAARGRDSSCPCCAFLPGDLFMPFAALDNKNIDGEQLLETGAEEEPELLEDDFVLDTSQVTWETLLRHAKQLRAVESATVGGNVKKLTALLVDSHGHAHLGGEAQAIYEIKADRDSEDEGNLSSAVLSLTCGVQPSDWDACLAYAAQSPFRLAALGVHPWYVNEILDSDNGVTIGTEWLDRLESLLQEHPNCLVGEVGLCKIARFVRTFPGGKQAALQLQRQVMVQQLQLACKYQRSVSIHCVDQHGIMQEILKDLADQPLLPPAISLHSFSGTAHHVKQLLQWEASLPPQRSRLPLLFFGFSHAVNYAMCSSSKSRRQGVNAIRAVPRDRLLAESDVHADANVVGGTASAVAYLAAALNEPVEVVAALTTKNSLQFLRRQQQQLSTTST